MTDTQPHDDYGTEVAPVRNLDTAHRRVTAGVYLAAALAAGVFASVTGISYLWISAALPFVAIAAYHVAAGRKMAVKDMEAIRIGSDAAPFDVGHASATLGFTGVLARPVWQVLSFGAGPTPRQQALVTVDALSGEVTGSFAEEVPGV